jgi:hypothetical protein
MPGTWEGVSKAKDPNAGFREAANKALDNYRADPGTPDGPVRLEVKHMYVHAENPIHEYIVVLGTGA